jgi:phage replication O-like protein O
MANPQLKNGYTRIANETLEHLMRSQLSANQWQVLLCVIRKTDGFGKEVDKIANFQIVEATGLRKDVVSRALHKLNDSGFLIRNGKLLGMNKDWEKWQFAELQTVKFAKQSTELAEQSTKVGSPLITRKKKETIQKKERIVGELTEAWGR